MISVARSLGRQYFSAFSPSPPIFSYFCLFLPLHLRAFATIFRGAPALSRAMPRMRAHCKRRQCPAREPKYPQTAKSDRPNIDYRRRRLACLFCFTFSRYSTSLLGCHYFLFKHVIVLRCAFTSFTFSHQPALASLLRLRAYKFFPHHLPH